MRHLRIEDYFIWFSWHLKTVLLPIFIHTNGKICWANRFWKRNEERTEMCQLIRRHIHLYKHCKTQTQNCLQFIHIHKIWQYFVHIESQHNTYNPIPQFTTVHLNICMNMFFLSTSIVQSTIDVSNEISEIYVYLCLAWLRIIL